MKRVIWLFVAFFAAATAAAQTPSIVTEVRAALAANDFTKGEQLIAAYRSAQGVTPAMLEASSWMGRAALAAREYDRADAYARETHQAALSLLRTRGLDDEPRLPIALGAAIEVQGQVAAARGDRSLGVNFLRQELNRYADTSIHKRIQKNINLLSLQGEMAPPLDRSEALGADVPALSDLKGRVVILFFWAHWCPDCKAQGPILAELLDKYGSQGLSIVAPTQRFGYVARGEDATPADERRYIEQIRDAHYGFLKNRPVPLAEANHKRYGVSSTPTLVLVDRQGRIAHYNPGQMTKDALEPRVRDLLNAGKAASQ
jgi:thiol-disulfide isomerase/thioredoxin